MNGEQPLPTDPPHLRVVHARSETGAPICGARRKKNAGVCRVGSRDAGKLYPNGRCRLHGGTSPGRPPITGYARTEKRNSAIARLRADCARLASEDAALLDTRPLLERMHSICQRLEDRVAEGDSPEFRRQALELYDQATALNRAGEAQEAARKLNELGTLLRDGVQIEVAVEAWSVNLERTAKRIEATLATRIARDRAMTERDIQKILTLWLGLLLDKYDDDPAALRVIASMRTGIEITMGQLYPTEASAGLVPSTTEDSDG